MNDEKNKNLFEVTATIHKLSQKDENTGIFMMIMYYMVVTHVQSVNELFHNVNLFCNVIYQLMNYKFYSTVIIRFDKYIVF